MNDRFTTSRAKMVQEQLVARGIRDERVLAAMREVPRHCFVDDALHARAYGDFPLPIAAQQTISQPYIVALMTQALGLEDSARVLEIGSGSGYQAAVLSRLCASVYTIERIAALLTTARRVFDRLGYFNIITKLDDGTRGWDEHSPFDGIIVTAGGPQPPEPLIGQLAEGGTMVIPVGDQYVQELQVLSKVDGKVETKVLERVRFVDLIGEHGW